MDDEGYDTRSKAKERARVLQDQLTANPTLDNNVQGCDLALPVRAIEDLLHFPLNPSLASLPVNTTKQVTAIGWQSFRGKERLLIELDNVMYQAGTNLEDQKDFLTQGCAIRIDKITTIRSSRQKEGICSIIQPGEWHKLVNYMNCSLLNSTHSSNDKRVLDIKEVEVKGSKRRLVLTDKGVFRFNKRAKIEKEVRVGDFL